MKIEIYRQSSSLNLLIIIDIDGTKHAAVNRANTEQAFKGIEMQAKTMIDSFALDVEIVDLDMRDFSDKLAAFDLD